LQINHLRLRFEEVRLALWSSLLTNYNKSVIQKEL